MNLIDYSFVNNIEFGVYSEKKLLSVNTNSFFDSAVNTCFSILEENGFTIFVKRPKYAKRLIFGKDYVGSEIELDLIEELVRYGDVPTKKFSEFRNEKYVNMALKR